MTGPAGCGRQERSLGRIDTGPMPGVHGGVIRRCCDRSMTASPAVRHISDGVSVVEVYGSTFLLEWLDLVVLAAAAADRLAAAAAVPPVGQQAA